MRLNYMYRYGVHRYTNLYVCICTQVYSGTGIFLCIVVYFIILNYILFLF